MSITKTTTVWCDEDNCPAYFRTSVKTGVIARERAEEQGWSCSFEEDYCPSHKSEQ